MRNDCSEVYNLEGVLNVNTDGYDEILFARYFYEGGEIELWGYEGEYFTKLSSGMFDGD